ncbi:MAG: RuBisCO large subunit C-terminal-like domain-containing protein [Actinomycetota bacterium]|nr:RuBisCO large subunit C-terminal-like domain-containing protein [Actinomycetota bacterium]
MIRATYELEPPDAARTLAILESTGVPNGPAFVQPDVVAAGDGRAVLDFPPGNWGADVTLLVSSVLAGEWADLAVFDRCRLVGVEWPPGTFAGPAFEAPDRVLVGAIVKPSLGLRPDEVAETVAAVARGGADLVKDDELLGDPAWCRLEERVSAVAAVVPAGVVYTANVTGPADSLVERARRAVDLGAGAVMVNAFAQGLDSVRLLRAAELGVPLFVHRVGAALWVRGERLGVAAAVIAEFTRLCGADYVQVGSFTSKVADEPDEVRAQIEACHRPLPGVRSATAVLGGGVGPDNAAEQIVHAGTRRGVMVLLGSAAYAHPGGIEEAVRATVEAIR